MANNPTQLTILQDEIRRRYDTLSKRLKQVARYILDNSNSVAFDTVASIAQQADVPPSTLIRFANAFGFSGFNEMKQMFKQHLMEETANYTERARLFRQTTSDESSPPETPTEILNMFTMVNNRGRCSSWRCRPPAMIWSARWPCWARRKIFTSLVCAGRLASPPI